MEWFRNILDREVEKRGGNVAQLARDWGMDRTTIDKWRNGSDPRLPQVEKVLAAVGGDIARALPDAPHASTDAELQAELSAAQSEAHSGGDTSAPSTLPIYRQRRTLKTGTFGRALNPLVLGSSPRGGTIQIARVTERPPG